MTILDDQIALYLNLATIKTRASGNLLWLTGAAIPMAVPASQSQETQVMVVGSCIWIANNDDVDTEFQYRLLTYLRIGSYVRLAAHVEAHQTRLLPSHAGNFIECSKPSEKLLARLTATVSGTPALYPAFVMPAVVPAPCHRYNLNGGGVPEVSGIVFVRGTYQGVNCGNEHAEQKLLAALGIYLRGNGTSIYSKRLHISGCKCACITCRGVLHDVKTRLHDGISKNRLLFDDPTLLEDRVAVGMGAAHPAGIKELDVNHYFAE